MTYVSPLLFLDLLLIKKFKGVSWEAMVRSGGYEPALLSSTTNDAAINQTYSAFGGNARPANIATTNFLAPSVHNMTLSSPLQLWRALPEDPPTPRRLLLELVASIVLYDAVFFLVHVSLHKVPYLYSRMHATHHDHAELHAQVTNQLDLGERLMLVLTANFSLQIIGAHVLTRTFFVPLFVLFLVQNHCGLNVLSYDKILPSGWGGELNPRWGNLNVANMTIDEHMVLFSLSLSLYSGPYCTCTASSIGSYRLCPVLPMVRCSL